MPENSSHRRLQNEGPFCLAAATGRMEGGSASRLLVSKIPGDLTCALAEQRREPLFAIAAEIDDTAAGSGVAGRPFQLGEARHHGRTKCAGEMMAPLAPVQTSLAHGPPRMGEAVGRNLQVLHQKTRALGGQFDVLLPLPYQPL